MFIFYINQPFLSTDISENCKIMSWGQTTHSPNKHQELKIFILTVKNPNSMPYSGYDCYHKFAVYAYNHEHARALAQEKSCGYEVYYEPGSQIRKDEKINFWTNSELTDCVVYDGQMGVISAEFNAG